MIDNLMDYYMNYKTSRLKKYGLVIMHSHDEFLEKTLIRYIKTYINCFYYNIFDTVNATVCDNNVLREISEIEYSPSLVDGDRFIVYMSDGNVVHVTLTKIDKLNKYNDIKDELDGKNGIVYLDSGDYVEIK